MFSKIGAAPSSTNRFWRVSQTSASSAIFNSLPVVDPETLPILMPKLFMAIANNFQRLTIVLKISLDFLKPHVTIKDDYEHCYYF